MLSNLRGPRVKCLHTLRSGKSVAASRPIVAKMASQSPPSEANTVALVQTAIAWANLHGLVVGKGDGVTDVSIIHAPFSLLPTPMPRNQFELVTRTMPVFNSLVQSISADTEYLAGTLAQAAKFDDFTARLLDVFASAADARDLVGSPITLGIHRSDYMLDGPTQNLLQIELNTIAASFGCLSTLVSRMHRDLARRDPSALPCTLDQMPEQDAMGGIARALAAAHTAYEDLASASASVVMVVQPGERNAYDQQWIQATLWEEHGVVVLRRTLHDIATHGAIDGGGHMSIDGHRVSVFYLRAGYTPSDYTGDKEWQARVMMESCDAVSCPSVAYQLVGSKKIQQDLAVPGRLERFVTNEAEVADLRDCFAGLWGLDDLADAATAEVIQKAIAAPEDFVLKPQREGGGNNLYGADMVSKLQAGKGLASYILMQRIHPAENQSILVRAGQHATESTLSELGIYGTYLQVKGQVVINEVVGHLLRTKTSSSNEGGVAAGFSVLDSPWLM